MPVLYILLALLALLLLTGYSLEPSKPNPEIRHHNVLEVPFDCQNFCDAGQMLRFCDGPTGSSVTPVLYNSGYGAKIEVCDQ